MLPNLPNLFNFNLKPFKAHSSHTRNSSQLIFVGQFPIARGQFPIARGQFPIARGQFPIARGDFLSHVASFLSHVAISCRTWRFLVTRGDFLLHVAISYRTWRFPVARGDFSSHVPISCYTYRFLITCRSFHFSPTPIFPPFTHIYICIPLVFLSAFLSSLSQPLGSGNFNLFKLFVKNPKPN